MPEIDNIAYTKYVPSQQLSIDDISKILYDPNKELYLKNMEALGNIASSTEAAGNATEAYINNLKFLPGDNSVDRDELLKYANEMIYKPWNEKTSPAELSKFVSDFGKRISPVGDVGKAKARYENKMKWEMATAKERATLSEEDNKLLDEEANKLLLDMDFVPEMENFVLDNFVAALPDFDTILSSQALHPIITAGWDSGDIHYQRGLRYKHAQDAINGKVMQDGSIRNWLEQYNRLHRTSYNLENCIQGYDESTGRVKIKNDLPEELKGALADAWVRATEYNSVKQRAQVTRTPTPAPTPTPGTHTENETSPMSKTATLYYNNTYGDIENILKTSSKKIGITGIEFTQDADLNKLIENSIVVEGDDNEKHIVFDPQNIVIFEDGKKGYVVKNDKEEQIAFFFDTNDNLNNLASKIENYINTREDVVIKNDFYELKKTSLSDSSKKFFGDNFNVLVKTDDGLGYVQDPEYKFNAGNIESIDGYSLSSPFGDILLMATIKNGDEKEDVILALKDTDDLLNICNNLKTHLKFDYWGEFFLSNPEYIRFTTDWYKAPIQIDNQGRYYKEIQFNNYNCDKAGVDNIPASFYGYSMRMWLPTKNNPESELTIQMVDSDGNAAKIQGKDVMTMQTMNRFFEALKIYQTYYENPNNLINGDSVVDYITNKIVGRDLDYDKETDYVQSYFVGKHERNEYGKDYNGETQQLVRLKKGINNKNGADLSTSYYTNGKQITKTSSIHIGDIVYDKSKKELYMIIRYGNSYILVDGNGLYRGEFTQQKRSNYENYYIYEGASRGQKVKFNH